MKKTETFSINVNAKAPDNGVTIPIPEDSFSALTVTNSSGTTASYSTNGGISFVDLASGSSLVVGYGEKSKYLFRKKTSDWISLGVTVTYPGVPPLYPIGYPVNKWRSAKIQAQSNRRYAKLAFYGDSNTGGFGAGITVGLNYNEDAHKSAYPSQAAALVNSRIMKCTRDSVFGTARAATAGVTYTQYDPRVTIGAGWTAADGSTIFSGGFFQATTTTAGTVDFQPAGPFNSFTVYYPQVSSGGTTNLVVQIDGSAAGYAAISNSNATARPFSTTYTIPGQLANHKISFTSPNASVNAWVNGITCWDSYNPGIVVHQFGNAGATAALLATPGTYLTLETLKYIAPDLTIVNCTINDQGAQTASAPYIADMTTIIDAALISGDVIVLVNTPNTNAGFSNGYMNTITPLLKAVCDARSVNMIDLRDYYGSTWAIANAAGFMDPTTGVHPNAVGSSVTVDAIFKYLQA